MLPAVMDDVTSAVEWVTTLATSELCRVLTHHTFAELSSSIIFMTILFGMQKTVY